jgi:hypothetical protein
MLTPFLVFYFLIGYYFCQYYSVIHNVKNIFIFLLTFLIWPVYFIYVLFKCLKF